MPGFSLRQNLKFKWELDHFRIDRIPPNGTVLLERLGDGEFMIVTQDTLLAEFMAGKITTNISENNLEKNHNRSLPLQAIPKHLLDEAKRRMTYIQALKEIGIPVFTREFTRPIALAVAKKIKDEKPPSTTTLYRWYREYRQDESVASLVPRFDQRGSRTSRQNERVHQLCQEATEEAFRASPRAGAKDVYIRLKGKIASENARHIDATLEVPSLRTVYRILDRTDIYDIDVLKNGKSCADRRLQINKNGIKTTHILERAEIDHTPLDLFLICEKSWLPLGRPTLTVIIDRHSRMPLGYYLSYGAPSAAAVMGALRHAVLPKNTPEEVIPGLGLEHAWPCYGVMDTLVVDNGLEFHGHSLESVAFDLGIRLQYCPKHAPQFKGAVERFLKTINYFFVHQLPGTSMARLQERGDYDPSKHAVLTLAEFKQILEKWFLDVYAQTVHKGIGVTPWEKWNVGMQHRILQLPESLQKLQLHIGLVAERSLRRDGIWLNNIRYSTEILGEILRKFGEGVRLRVLYDPEDLGEIHVWAPDAKEPVTVAAVDYSYAKGLTSQQHELIGSKLRDEGRRSESPAARDQARLAIAQTIESLMASRKQRSRRQAAALRGITSAKPSGQTSEQNNPKSKRPSLPAKKGSEEFPKVLPSFQITKNGVSHG